MVFGGGFEYNGRGLHFVCACGYSHSCALCLPSLRAGLSSEACRAKVTVPQQDGQGTMQAGHLLGQFQPVGKSLVCFVFSFVFIFISFFLYVFIYIYIYIYLIVVVRA